GGLSDDDSAPISSDNAPFPSYKTPRVHQAFRRMAPARRPLISNSGEAAYCERLGLGRPSKTMQSPVAARHRGNVALAETLLVQGAQAVPQLLFRNSRSGRDERRMLVVQPHAH